jgi:hypothetical protein
MPGEEMVMSVSPDAGTKPALLTLASDPPGEKPEFQ